VLVAALALPLAAMTLTPQTAQAGKDNPKAQGSLLKHAQEHPNDTDPRHRKVNKKLGLINGCAAEPSGKEIGKLAKHNRETQRKF
jgi:hypothetical protein